MDANPTVVCTVSLEWFTPTGSSQRKVCYKNAQLRLIRNEFRTMFVEISTDKAKPAKFELKKFTVHNKFMNEGKASIKFEESRCTIFLSNAPPSQLLNFLKTIFFKTTGSKDDKGLNTSLRTQLLSKKPKQVEEISPVTAAEIENSRQKVSKATDTTPSPLSKKRKLSAGHTTKAPAAKKLYAASPVPNLEMNVEQKEVLEACLAGHNVFFTGSAGTGKSFLLKKIIAALPPDVTVATASTGVAACHIGGITLHQFAGIGRGEATLDNCYMMASKPAKAQVWRKCKHLIIDEISMIDGKYFEKIEAVARNIRRNDKPFGGVQLILCGDFFQLPPVIKTSSKNSQDSTNFCFQTSAWDRCVQRIFELKQVHRQSDSQFVEILNCIRLGNVTDEIANKLIATAKQKIEKDGILATRLCSHTQDAVTINESKLNSLPGEGKTFEAEDSDRGASKDLDQMMNVPGKLVLKVGAQVMLLKNINISRGLVNGARGIVKEFRDGLPVVRFRDSKEYVARHERWVLKMADGRTLARRQVPLQLAWAFSIHKSQGLTLDCVEMSLARVFEAGQAYVALSRAQSMETLRVLDFSASQVWANPAVLEFYRKMRRRMQEMELVPLGRKAPSNENKGKVREGKLPRINSKLLVSKPLVSIS